MSDLLQINNNHVSNQKSMATICPIQIHHTAPHTIVLKKTDRTLTNKRPSNTSSINDATNNNKRIKATTAAAVGSVCNDVRPSPQLLQQLMAPTPQQQRVRAKDGRHHIIGDTGVGSALYQKSADTSKWILNNAGINSQAAIEQHASNSVLKNLLVSGCDVSAGYICVVPIRSKKILKA